MSRITAGVYRLCRSHSSPPHRSTSYRGEYGSCSRGHFGVHHVDPAVLTTLWQYFFCFFFLKKKLPSSQGCRSWQPFGEGKNGHQIFPQAGIYYFHDKCVVFARNCKFANLQILFSLICNVYHVIVHFLPKKHCF